MGGCFTKKVSADQERNNTEADENEPENSFGEYKNEELRHAFGGQKPMPPHKLLG